MLLCKRLSKKIGGRTILENVTMQIDPGECVCILGAAGSGKTTLFDLLITATKPSSGSIEVDGVPMGNLPPLILQLLRSRLGIIFQNSRLLPDLTLRENIAYPLEIQGMSTRTTEQRVDILLRRLGLDAKAECFADDLSISERAIAGLARAVVAEPMLLIADEPFQTLDDAQKTAAIALLMESQAAGATIIILTSDAALPAMLSARTLRLARGNIEEMHSKPTKQVAPPRRTAEAAIEEITMSAGRRKVKITSIGA